MTKVKVLRNFRHGDIRGLKGKVIDLPPDLAANLAKGAKPAVEIVKEK